MPGTVLSTSCITGITKIKKADDPKSGGAVKHLGLSYTAFLRMQSGAATFKELFGSFLWS